MAILFMLLGVAAAHSLEERPTVVHIRVHSIIHPVAAEFIADSLQEADRSDAVAFVMELSTPGGLSVSTRDVITAMLESELPVVVYVSPSGTHAASAGFYILMAADIAAMAPGTNTGAAHPVGGQGEDIEGTMGEKVEEDAAAQIRSLAERSGRNAELAEEAVVKSRSFTAEEALENGLIELIAENLEALLEKIDGRELPGDSETPRKLATAGAEVRTLEMSG
ncbi:MAG: ATP-dependent Clp protease proteolytic subunit, partial [Thermoanaerobaculia bacterium]